MSVVVPVLNEADRIDDLLANLDQELAGAEWIFVDGGSSDGTRERLADDDRVRLLETTASRGGQLATGAEQATGECLLLMHADSRLNPGAATEMTRVLAGAGVSAGAFRLKIDHADDNYRLMERLVAWRCRRFGLPYGDQGLFFLRSTLQQVGGLEPLPLMEDVALVRRLKRQGNLVVSNVPMTTSARRYERRGFWRACTRNVILVLLYHAGVSAGTLRKLYD